MLKIKNITIKLLSIFKLLQTKDALFSVGDFSLFYRTTARIDQNI